MKKIELTQGYFALVDDEDFEYLNQWKWSIYSRPSHSKTLYAIRNYRKEDGIKGTIKMHQQLLGKIENTQIDHVDGNGLNNSRKNLRRVKHGQNIANRPVTKNNLLKLKGVTKRKNRFQARIIVNKKQIHLGSFKTAKEAHEAYKKAALELHGEFAKW